MTETQNTIYQFYKKKGLSDKAIAGIMGNIAVESNFNTNTLNPNDKGKSSIGLFQWRGGRKTALENYAKTNKKDVNDLQTQLEFSWVELNTTEKKTLDMLKNSNRKTAGEIAVEFDKLFERSDGSRRNDRKKFANNFYNNEVSFIDKTINGSQHGSEVFIDKAGISETNGLLKTPIKLILIIILIIFGVLFLMNAIGATGAIKNGVTGAINKVGGKNDE